MLPCKKKVILECCSGSPVIHCCTTCIGRCSHHAAISSAEPCDPLLHMAFAGRALGRNMSDGSENSDWYEACSKPITESQSSRVPAPVSLAQPTALPRTSADSEGLAKKRKTDAHTSAWKDWKTPTLGREAPTKVSTQEGKAGQGMLQKQALAASMAAQKAAAAAEASIKLASLASQQLEKASEASKKSQLTLAKAQKPDPKLQTPTTNKSAEAQQTLPVANTANSEDQDPDTVTVDAEDGVTGGEPAASGKKRAPRGTMDTFAGRTPPKGEEKAATFFMKRRLFEETREELQKKFPGKKITSGKSNNQETYWKHVKIHIDKKSKQKKGKMSQVEIREAIKEAAQLWKGVVSKELEAIHK